MIAIAKVLTGSVGGVALAMLINVGVLELVWHGNGPTWYYGPVVIVSLLCGAGGTAVGMRWADA